MFSDLNKVINKTPLQSHHLQEATQWVNENEASIFSYKLHWALQNKNTVHGQRTDADIAIFKKELIRVKAVELYYKEEESKKKKAYKTLEQINAEKEFNRREQALKALNVGDKLKYANSNYEHIPTTSLDALREWQASGKHFLLMVGSTDSSKTFAGVVGVTDWMEFTFHRDSLEGWWNGLFLKASHCSRIAQFPLSDEYKKLWAMCSKTRFLMLDELIGKGCTESMKKFVEAVISERETNNNLYTIITSNCTVDELLETYDDRVLSRIQGDGLIVFCPKENLRGVDLSLSKTQRIKEVSA